MVIVCQHCSQEVYPQNGQHCPTCGQPVWTERTLHDTVLSVQQALEVALLKLEQQALSQVVVAE